MRKIDQGTIKILLIEKDFNGRYWIIQERTTITSTVTLEEAVRLLKNETLDLIVSEPHHLFILNSLYQ
jgi:hypothetical protein